MTPEQRRGKKDCYGCYGVNDWKLDEMQDLDRMTRKQLCMNQMLAKKADVDRIYLPCLEGGRSLINPEKRIQNHNDRTTDIHDKQG